MVPKWYKKSGFLSKIPDQIKVMEARNNEAFLLLPTLLFDIMGKNGCDRMLREQKKTCDAAANSPRKRNRVDV